MSPRVPVVLACLLVAGCGCFAGGRWHPFGAPPAQAPAAPAQVRPVESAQRPVVPPLEIAKTENGDRAKRITDARSDLKVGLTALKLRAVTACTEPGTACVDNQALIDRARALDKQLAAALLDPALPVDWAAVTTVLRAVVDSAMKTVPK